MAASPVFYQVPLYRQIAADKRVELTVIFASSAGLRPYNAGFGTHDVVWSDDLTSGYTHQFLRRADRNDVLGGYLALRDADVLSAMRRSRFDVLWVHGFMYATLSLALAAARFTRRPVLLREEQTLLHERPWVKRMLRDPALRLLFRNTYALTIGSQNRAHFRTYGVPEERIFDVPYCVDNASLQARGRELAPRRAELRSRFGLPPEIPVVLFAGKLTEKKQPLRALEAFETVRRRHRCAFLVVGAGPLEPELRAAVASRRIPDVVFAGFLNRSELPDAYAVADVFLLPSSHHETWGIVVNEAMNFALPVVASDKVGSSYDLIRDGWNGYVAPHDDTDAFASAIERLVVSEDTRRTFGRRSIEHIAGWSYERAAEGVVAAALAAHSAREGRP